MQALWIIDSVSEDEAALRTTARTFIKNEVAPRGREAASDPRRVMPDLLRRAAAAGLTAPDIPETYGGIGLPRRASALVVEELCRDFSFGVSLGVHVGIGMWPTLLYGSEEQRRAWMPRILSAEAFTAYALTEPDAGSDAMGIRMRAERTARGFRLDGQKLWISNAGFADVFTAFAKLPDGITAFLVPRTASGLTVGAEEHKMGINGSSTCAVFFDGVEVAEDAVVGEIGRGHKIAFGVLNLGRLKLAAASVGMARQALGEAVRHAASRKQFGQPLVAFPAIREMLARSAASLYAAESLVYRVADLIDGKERLAGDDLAAKQKVIDDVALECSAAKVVASEALGRIVDDAVQIFGGLGFGDTAVSRIYRDARVCRIFEGTTQVNSLVVIERLVYRAARGGSPDVTEPLFFDCLPGAYWPERVALVRAFAHRLADGIRSLGGTKPFLMSVNKPEVQRVAWPLAQELIPLLAFDAVCARTDPMDEIAMALARCAGAVVLDLACPGPTMTDEDGIVDALLARV